MRNLKRFSVLLFLPVLFSCNANTSEEDNQLKMSDYNVVLTTYSKVELKITTKIGSDELEGNYACEKTSQGYKVNYEYEAYSLIGEGSSSEYISTKEGSYNVVGEEFTNKVGDESNIDFKIISLKEFKFNDSLYKDVQVNNDGVVLANINNFGQVFRIEGNYTNAFVNLYISNAKADKLLFSFNKGNNQVVMTYSFTY